MQRDLQDRSRPPSITGEYHIGRDTKETPRHSSRSGDRSGSRSPHGHSLSGTPKKFTTTTTPSTSTSKKIEQDAWIKKLTLKLEDNRYKGGDKEAIKKLHELNRLENTSNKLLKRILNVVFISTGICLLLAVIVVIVYTAIVKPDLSMNQHQSVSMGHQGIFKSLGDYEEGDGSPGLIVGFRPSRSENRENQEEEEEEDSLEGRADTHRNSRQTIINRGGLPSRGCKLTPVVVRDGVQMMSLCPNSVDPPQGHDEGHGQIEVADMK